MRHIHILTLLLLCSVLNSYGQVDLRNKWYTFSFDMIKVVEYNFEPILFTRNKLDWELKDLPGKEIAKIIKIIKQNNNLYYLMQDQTDTSSITISIFSLLKPDTSFIQPSASEEHTNFKNINDALNFIKADTFQRPGLTFYSQKEFDRLKSLPSPSTINKEDYKKYLLGLINVRQDFESFSASHKDDFGLMFFFIYIPNQARVTLASLNYNPVVTDKELEEVNDKFKNDIGLKDLLDKALKFE